MQQLTNVEKKGKNLSEFFLYQISMPTIVQAYKNNAVYNYNSDYGCAVFCNAYYIYLFVILYINIIFMFLMYIKCIGYVLQVA